MGDRLTDSNFWSNEDIVKARFQYAESRQKITYGVNDVTPKSWTVYLICFDVVSCIVQDSCRA